MIKCLMLDVDGVLVDGRPEDGRSWDSTLFEDLGIAREALAAEFFSRHWQEVVLGKQDLFAALSASMIRIGSNVQPEDLVNYWFKNDSRIVKSVLLGCREIRTSGTTVFLFTNQEHTRAKYLMEVMGLKDEVDGIIYSAEAGFSKPRQEFFRYAQDLSGFSATECLLIDDSVANVEGARKAGWAAVLWGKNDDFCRAVGQYIKF